tara:strand:- start:425 stop:1597 length:1173 start_codon:yes stop_codon:yes gene_type:complete
MKVYINEPRYALRIESFLLKEKLLVNLDKCDFRIDKCELIDPIDEENTIDDYDSVDMTLGVGSFEFIWKGQRYVYNRERIGKPIPSAGFGKEGIIYEDVYINDSTCEDGNLSNEQDIFELCKQAIKEKRINGYFKTMVWHSSGEFWKDESMIPEREMDSVVLDRTLKSKLIGDMNEFVNDSTKEWYKMHGIPYKRGYLFSGPPGVAKTSTIRALATMFKRNIYRINVVGPNMTDTTLISAINSVSKEAIIVFEDIDALFENRFKKEENMYVSFSGLLNCLDGVGVGRGQLFILTTNHPEKLDPALLRKGRVDTHFEFDYCTKEQAEDMFKRFYPTSNTLSKIFSDSITENTSTAELQSHFIENRTKSAEDASVYVKKEIVKKREYLSMFT